MRRWRESTIDSVAGALLHLIISIANSNSAPSMASVATSDKARRGHLRQKLRGLRQNVA